MNSIRVNLLFVLTRDEEEKTILVSTPGLPPSAGHGLPAIDLVTDKFLWGDGQRKLICDLIKRDFNLPVLSEMLVNLGDSIPGSRSEVFLPTGPGQYAGEQFYLVRRSLSSEEIGLLPNQAKVILLEDIGLSRDSRVFTALALYLIFLKEERAGESEDILGIPQFD
jgi:hypothetical protein